MVLILGAKGMLGGELVKIFGNEAVAWDRGDCDVTDFEKLKVKILALKPSAIINCAAYNDVDKAENNRETAFKLNAELPENLAEIANACNSVLVHFSTNYVFDGQKQEYFETDKPHPLSIYGLSKYEGERLVQKRAKKFYIIRTAVLFGPKGQSTSSKKSFIQTMLDIAAETDTIKAVTDEVNSLTYAPDLAAAVKQILAQKQACGIYHISNSGFTSWYGFAREIFKLKNMAINLVPVSSDEFRRVAVRPKQAILANIKLPPLRPWQDALAEFLHEKP